MQEYVNARIMGNPPVKVSKSATLLDIARDYAGKVKYPILIAKVNNQLQELNRTLTDDCEIEFLDITNSNGYKTYQRSTVFLMVCAAKEILGKDTRVVVEHSINKNYYCEIPDQNIDLTEDVVKQIETRMKELAARDIPIERLSLSLEEGIALSKECGLRDKEHILRYRKTTNVNFYKLDWFYNYFYGQIVPSTGYLNKFKLLKEPNGFLIVFPDTDNPDEFSEVKSLKKISQVFFESSQWGKILKVDTVGALNDKICTEGIGNIIRINEALHEKKIAAIADMIHSRLKRVVLIAGPSSSGKTTFANRLCVQLRVNGLEPHVISLDDYYLDRDKVPLDEFGKPDFETIDSIDVPAFNKDLELLMAGETVDIPRFNFITGKREYKGNFLKLGPSDVLVIEGIHGLNDRVGETADDSVKFRIFISALTQLNIDDHNRIPTTDTRIIRRIVRDNQFRGFDCLTTISVWPSVVRGETKYIFPYQEKADAMFNSALVYEMCLLKQFAEPLLFKVDKEMPQYTEARRLLKFLDIFIGSSSESVPNNSIIREFIGGSVFQA